MQSIGVGVCVCVFCGNKSGSLIPDKINRFICVFPQENKNGLKFKPVFFPVETRIMYNNRITSLAIDHMNSLIGRVSTEKSGLIGLNLVKN